MSRSTENNIHAYTPPFPVLEIVRTKKNGISYPIHRNQIPPSEYLNSLYRIDADRINGLIAAITQPLNTSGDLPNVLMIAIASSVEAAKERVKAPAGKRVGDIDLRIISADHPLTHRQANSIHNAIKTVIKYFTSKGEQVDMYTPDWSLRNVQDLVSNTSLFYPHLRYDEWDAVVKARSSTSTEIEVRISGPGETTAQKHLQAEKIQNSYFSILYLPYSMWKNEEQNRQKREPLPHNGLVFLPSKR